MKLIGLNVQSWGKLLDERWLLDNITTDVRDGTTTLLWRVMWLDSFPLEVQFRRLFELADNKLAIVA